MPTRVFRWTPDPLKIWIFSYLSTLSSISTFVVSVMFCNTKFGYPEIVCKQGQKYKEVGEGGGEGTEERFLTLCKELCPECLPPSAIPVLFGSLVQVLLWIIFFAIYRRYQKDYTLANILFFGSFMTCITFYYFFEDLTFSSELLTFAVEEENQGVF